MKGPVRHKYQKGQSYLELAMLGAVLTPIFIMLPSIANMLLLQGQGHNASRYVAWERTAYAGVEIKDSDTLSAEVRERFLTNPDRGFGDSSPELAHEHWKDFWFRHSVVDSERAVRVSVDSSRSATAGNQNASAWMAERGPEETRVQLDTLQSSSLTLPLQAENIALVNTTRKLGCRNRSEAPAGPGPDGTKLSALRWSDDCNNPRELPTDPEFGEQGYYIASSSALVADGWAPVNDAMFHDRVAAIRKPAQNFQNFWEGAAGNIKNVFDELGDHMFQGADTKASLDMVEPDQSTNIPANLLQPYQ